jgi:hypothetical protein
MGADIYLESVSAKQREKFEPLFQQAVATRDKWCKRTGFNAHAGYNPAHKADAAYKRQKAQYDKLQKHVSEAYDGMYEAGYFRDSYNSSSLFWMLGLSWWKLGEELLDDERNLPIAKAKEHLALMEAKRAEFDKLFAAWVSAKRKGKRKTKANPYAEEPWKFEGEGETVPEWEAYLRDKLDRWIALLKQSIELNEPLHWSV